MSVGASLVLGFPRLTAFESVIFSCVWLYGRETEFSMSKAAKPAKADKTSGKQAQGKQAIRDAHGAKPRNPVVDFMVFVGGVGSLVYVFNTIAPN